jgi:Cu(I)/Ag(I) efflux system membrane fusion protein
MMRFVTALALVCCGIVLGYLGQSQWGTHSSAPMSEETERKPLYWVAPMDPNYRRPEPGKSPMGMDLVPVYEESEPGLVRISPVFQSNFGVTTAQAQRGRLSLSVEALGYVNVAEDRVAHVHPRVEGWIEKAHVFAVGDQVEAGQPLFEMYSPEVVSAQVELIANLNINNLPLVAASERRLRLMGLSEAAIQRVKQDRVVQDSIEFLAPSSGVVTEIMMREGMFVTPDVEMIEIVDLSRVWVRAELFESQQNWVEQGQPVVVSIPSLPGRAWQGHVDYIYPTVDSTLRTTEVRIVLDNEDGVLKPNMYAQLDIAAGVTKAGIIIPEQALIRGERESRVVVKVSDEHFRSVRVRPGLGAEGEIIVLRGLNEGDQVVTSGQFLIDSESNLGSESARMNGQ